MRVISLIAAGVFGAGAVNCSGQSITSFSPNYGQTNSSVNVYGTVFNSTTRVWFGSVRASATLVDYSGSIYHMIATVPYGSTGNVLIGVGNGTASPTVYSASYFTNITKAPFITSFSPESGAAGTEVTIYGVNFNGVTNIYFNGAKAASFTYKQTDQITATAPTNVTSGLIKVSSTNGSYTSLGTFSVPPTITNITPATAHVGDSVLIQGANFLGASAVEFAGFPAVLPSTATRKSRRRFQPA